MVCIYCGSRKTTVVNSRQQKRSNAIWRRRACLECSAIVTTLENIDLESALIVTHKSSYEAFQRDKLFISIYESCKHLKDAQKSATMLTDTVIKQLYPLIIDASITKSLIVAHTGKVLHRYNNASGVQYMAYHPMKS